MFCGCSKPTNCNLNVGHDINSTAAPHRIYLARLNNHLDKFKEIIVGLKAIGKRSLQIVRKKILTSIPSLKLLLQDMKTEYSEVYNLCINYTKSVCCRGSSKHPSPLHAIKKIGMIVLGKSTGT